MGHLAIQPNTVPPVLTDLAPAAAPDATSAAAKPLFERVKARVMCAWNFSAQHVKTATEKVKELCQKVINAAKNFLLPKYEKLKEAIWGKQEKPVDPLDTKQEPVELRAQKPGPELEREASSPVLPEATVAAAQESPRAKTPPIAPDRIVPSSPERRGLFDFFWNHGETAKV